MSTISTILNVGPLLAQFTIIKQSPILVRKLQKWSLTACSYTTAHTKTKFAFKFCSSQWMASDVQTSKKSTRDSNIFYVYAASFLIFCLPLTILFIGQMDYEVVEEIIYGLESGILFGMASVISKMGFVFLEQGFSKMLVPTCLTISICCSATGFYYQTQGLKHGRAIVLSTCAAVASIVTGVLAGMLALGEQLPSAPAARFSLLLGWLLIVVGVILLVSSTWLLRHLPQPFHHFKRSSADRNPSLIRTGSLRLRDPNPTAVIHAATLHHLISSPSKEKA
ncbi:hypothetical protein SADUNF_Sadunf06G0179500 [Salix dunnii]|uniref:Probable magnesium transporter n=1 Tax=Salix dunnii TaxID=1413687 RepID=A0A835K2A6_9ROSI|nr:hypothetical protein SADUNF_Sadunf06G0179500 [Salix dunnii]